MKFNSLQSAASSHPLARRSVQAALLLLLIAVLALVVFLLPSLIQPKLVTEAAVATASTETGIASVKAESPWQQAQQAKIRRQAQDILSKIIPLQEKLQQLQVKDWAVVAYQDAIAEAEQGDQYYKSQAFDQALQHYQLSLDKLERVHASIGENYQQQLKQGRTALNANQAEAAIAALTIASQLESELKTQAKADGLLKRANVLDEVLDIVHKGDRFKKQQQWKNALGLYQQALKLDPASPLAQQAVAVAKQQISKQRFNKSMSDAYSAMQKKQYQQAKNIFQQALAVMPGAADAKAGLQQASEQLKQDKISRLVRQAQKQSRQEQWPQATASYQQALQQDPSFVAAKIGQIKSQARLNLDQALVATLANVSLLQDPLKRQQAQKLLRDARKIPAAGERLKQQISQLQVTLIKASSPLQVSISSDGFTNVHIYKVKRLGAINTQELSLTPGRYTVVGSRSGYQDIRQTLTVAHGSANALRIVCTVKI